MRKPRSYFLLFVLLVLGLSVMVPAEDVAETAYDESEPLPYQSIPTVASTIPQAAASESEAERRVPQPRAHNPLLLTAVRTTSAEAVRHVEARAVLALLGTLLC